MPRKPKGAAQVEKLSRALDTLVIEWATPSAFKPNPWNPNRQNEHEFAMLCKSIGDAGFTQPIMVVEVAAEHSEEWAPELTTGRFALGDLVIVDGEHRWRAAQQLGIDPIPFVKMPYGAAQARLSTLQMNRARGSEDVELATEILRDLETLGWLDFAAESLDMSDEEINRLLEDVAPPEALAAESFSEAWHPAGDTIAADGQISATATASHSPDALAAAREGERRLASARTEEERQMIGRDMHLFRLVLSFTGAEGDLVRRVLGDEPAGRVLAWCKAEEMTPAVSETGGD
jgi:ParB-like chromosome segregation protein Spo0J